MEKKKRNTIIKRVFYISLSMFLLAFAFLRQKQGIALTFYLFFVIISLEYFFSFFISYCFRYKIWGKPITSHRMITLSFALIAFVYVVFFWCFLELTAITSPVFYFSEIFQEWRIIWRNMFLIKLYSFYVIHKQVLEP
jgi:hypothetical protein